MLRNANGINKIEQVFTERVGGYNPELFIPDGANTAALHLGIKGFRLDVSHEHYHLNWLNISSGGHKRYGYGYTEFLVIPEMADKFIAVSSRIGNLLDKLRVILLSEYFFCYLDDIACVRIVQSKNQRLGEIIHIGLALRVIEHLRINGITICLQDKLYLGRVNNASV